MFIFIVYGISLFNPHKMNPRKKTILGESLVESHAYNPIRNSRWDSLGNSYFFYAQILFFNITCKKMENAERENT